MYNEHFGLTQAPFRITPDTGLFYTGGGRGDVLDALVYAVTSGEGIVKVVGEVGTGKTMLCRMLEERLPDNVQIAYLANPSLTPEDILHAVALELGLELAPGAPRLQVMHRLQRALLERHARNQRVVALVEEAQSMPVDTLEEIRLLSNLETKNEKLLQIILFGQPELDENLGRPEIRQLRERITHSFALKPLGVDEIKDYVAFRLRASGYRGRDAFTRHAYRAMSRASEGLTRRVNIIADKAMLAAYAEDTHDVSSRHVKIAILDSEFGAGTRRSRAVRPGVTLAATIAGAALLAGAVGWYAGAQSGGGDGNSGPVAPAGAVVAEAPGSAAEATSSRVPVSEVTATGVTPVRDGATGAVSVSSPAAQQVESGVAPAQPEAPVTDVTVVAASVPQPPAASSPEPAEPGARPAVATPVAAELSATPPDPAPVAAGVTTSPADARAAAAADGGRPEPGPVAAPAAATLEIAAAEPVVSVAATPDAGRAPRRAASGPVTPPAAPATPAEEAPVDATPAVGTTASRTFDSLLDERLERTYNWLASVNPGHFSVQLLATDAERRGNLEAFLERRERAGELERVFVYRTRINGRLWYGVLFGEFESFSAARDALESLPRELTRHQPFIRNVRDIAVAG